MKMLNKFGLTILLVMATAFTLSAQNSFFSDISERAMTLGNSKRVLTPGKYRTVEANLASLKNFLWSLPKEQNGLVDRSHAPVISLPMPNGQEARFRVWESSVQAPGLEAKFPEIKTFLGQGVDDPYAVIRLDFNPYFGFHAQILTVNGDVYIDPFARGNISYYQSYYSRDNIRSNPFFCETRDEDVMGKPGNINAGPCRGTQLYTYRLAVACTGEYALAVGGTTPAALHAAIVTTVNRVTGVYEKEVAIRLILIDNNNLIEFLDPSTDPFTGNNSAGTLINESQTVITSTIGSGNFDIGHTFSTGGGGLAGLGVVCNINSKARGITGSPSPVGDAYDIDYVAHEMGHQFGGSHTFNSVTSSCGGGNRSAAQAYEVGSGTTIQAYAGICGSDNIQPNSDPFFHAVSFDQISNYVEAGGASCRNVIATGNALPVILTMDNNNANIPLNTPFTLNGTASDANGDALTYCWEQWDLTASGGTWNGGATSTTAPLFKSRIPKTSGSRTFPDMAVILAGYPANPAASMGGLKGETLPQVGRTMKFRLTVRDNRAGGGGVVSGGEGCQTGFTGTFQVNAVANTGPFVVTVPNGGESYIGGSTQTITWNVAGTDQAPISTTNVRITLSTDGGNTYPTVLAASTPNDGTEALVIPSVVTSTARVRIEAVNNIYFDISNANFSITAAPVGFDFNTPPPATVSCAGPATTSITLSTISNGGYSTPVNLSASGNPAGTTVSFGTNPVTPGNSTVVTISGVNTLAAGTYNFTVTGVSGSITQNRILSFTVQSGTGPTITTQPASQTVCAGTNVTFNAAATGATGYQWQVSTNGGTSYVSIGGATGASFTLNNVATTQDGFRYQVVASSQCGATTSTVAVLTVQAPPAIGTQPQSQTLCLGSNATFNSSASGTNISYQWQLSTDGGTTFSNISGATTANYTASNITTAMNNNRYRVVVSGTCTPAATSSAAVLTVISPVAITNSPANITICETGNVAFSAAGTSAQAISYQWQMSTDNGTTWSNVANNIPYSGANTSTLNITGVAANMNNYRYRALLSNTTCTTGTPTTAAVLTVNARPTVTLSASSTSLLPGQTSLITASIQPSAAGFNIRWIRNNDTIPNVTGTTYTADITKLGDYKVYIVNTATGCNNISPVLKIDAQPSSAFFIYPNPNSGRFTVAYYNSNNVQEQWTVSLYSANGSVARVPYALNVAGPYTLFDVKMPTAAAGVYLVVLSDGSGKKIATGKVMIQH